jgi:hypothetical protein
VGGVVATTDVGVADGLADAIDVGVNVATGSSVGAVEGVDVCEKPIDTLSNNSPIINIIFFRLQRIILFIDTVSVRKAPISTKKNSWRLHQKKYHKRNWICSSEYIT